MLDPYPNPDSVYPDSDSIYPNPDSVFPDPDSIYPDPQRWLKYPFTVTECASYLIFSPMILIRLNIDK